LTAKDVKIGGSCFFTYKAEEHEKETEAKVVVRRLASRLPPKRSRVRALARHTEGTICQATGLKIKERFFDHYEHCSEVMEKKLAKK
jgi:hypothetical protein